MRTAADLTRGRYYFELTNSPNLVWVDLGIMNLDAGEPVRLLNPDNIALSGNVIGDFEPGAAPF